MNSAISSNVLWPSLQFEWLCNAPFKSDHSTSFGRSFFSAAINSPWSSRSSGGTNAKASLEKISSSVMHATSSFASRVSSFDLNKPYSFSRNPR